MSSQGELLDARGTQISATPPGLIVVPNLDADGQHLPLTVDVKSHRLTKLDLEHRTKTAGDDELVAVDVRLDPAIDLAAAQVLLSFQGPLRKHLRLYNARKQALASRGDAVFALRFEHGRTLRVLVEADSLTHTPLAPADDAPTQMVLSIDGRIATHAVITIAPFLHAHNLDRAERLYVCEIDAPEAEESNFPTLSELTPALADAKGVALVKVPLAISLGDAWMQDQLEMGYCHAPGRLQRIVAHLPRARANIVQTGPLANLGGFVEGHFPSKDLGMFRDFWKLTLGQYESADGVSHTLGFAESYEFQLLLGSVDAAWSLLAGVFDFYARDAELKEPFLSALINDARSGKLGYLERHQRLPSAWRKLQGFLADERARLGTEHPRSRQSKADEAAVKERVDRAKETVAMQPLGGRQRLRLTRNETLAAFLDPQQVDALVERLAGLHDSINYGGNIETSPPFAGALLGKIVIGTSPARPMERQLKRFLLGQGVQPTVKIDTSWLDVAHVDEIMSFVASNRGTAGFAIPHASPATALTLLTTAFEVKRKALLAGADMTRYFLTDMLRGKYWLYTSPAKGKGFDILRPPFIHRAYHFPNYAEPERGHSRTYHAALNVDLLFERLSMQTNRTIQAEFIEPLATTILEENFRGVGRLALPVLFDEMSADEPPAAEQIITSAFLPNVVNMQVVNGLLLVPKPYGPRMGVDGAIATLKQCLDSKTYGLLTEREFDRAQLFGVSHWEKGSQRIARKSDGLDDQDPDSPLGTQGLELRKPSTDLERIARQFGDGFLEGAFLVDEAIVQKAILDHNKTHFDAAGNLRPGWHRLTIPERSVDLFEAFTWAQLTSIGNAVRFVDSWYYHVRLGEIHCGTQVLRRAAPKVNWWEMVPPRA